MLDVLYSTGLRVSELIGLRVMDLDRRSAASACIGKATKNASCHRQKSAGPVDRTFATRGQSLCRQGSR